MGEGRRERNVQKASNKVWIINRSKIYARGGQKCDGRFLWGKMER
jgi:hypothetical protein